MSAARWLRQIFGDRAGAARSAYRHVFGGPDGEMVLHDLRELCFGKRTTFVPGDPQETAFNEGKRSVLLHIESVLGLKAGELFYRIEESDQ